MRSVKTSSKICPIKAPLNLRLCCLGSADHRDIFRSVNLKTSLHSDRHLERWVTSRLLTRSLKVGTISLNETRGWSINQETGDIGHDSGRFFSITGAKVRHRSETFELEWDQPIIDQPEVGILGIIAKKINGVLHFCLQAKEEPGNINSVQLSPTLQATYSNYTRVHGGTPPKFIEYFTDPARGRIIFAKLQTEDGGRFLYKSNRNMIVLVEESELEYLPNEFIWVTLRQVGKLLQRDNLVHACTRSIIAALALSTSSLGQKAANSRKHDHGTFHDSSLASIFQWIDNRKATNHFQVRRTALNSLKEWGMDRDGSFSHEHGRFFRVVGLNVESKGREVTAWNQPILDSPGTGVIGLLTKMVDGECFFLMNAKAELGNRGIIQIGPTVQFTPGNYIGNEKLQKPFLFEEFYKPERFPTIHQSLQSEEGARFYNESHIHRILQLPQSEELTIPDDFHWVSQTDLNLMINLGEMVSSSARSIISLMISNECSE
ncbi:MAG: NDP-hexose 2,3-dehydratase family protein [Geobacteraceae bacterium]|nr:NDP-hexose 2,3-dehydratase family protein [Geobacteraceae bacterium]